MGYKNIEARRAYQKKWRLDNREHHQIISKKWRELNKDKRKKYELIRDKIYMGSWEDYIPSVTNCEMCNDEIKFHSKDVWKAIHFDHRDEGKEPIKESPTNWMQRHKRNSENEAIWKECNFGMLCYKCNKFLPTIGRKQHLINSIRYVFGEDIKDLLVHALDRRNIKWAH